MDRRTRKSKNAMKKALFELMTKKPFSQITVSELCENADINRSTFYANYTEMKELLSEIHQDLLDKMMNHTDRMASDATEKQMRTSVITGMVTYIYERQKEVKILFLNNENHLLEQNMFKCFKQKYIYNPDSVMDYYPLLYHSLGFFSLINQWVLDDFPLTPSQLAHIILHESDSLYENKQSLSTNTQNHV